MESGFRRSSDEVYLQLGSWAESSSYRSPDEVCLQLLESRMEPGSGSCRSPGGVYLQLGSWTESGRSLSAAVGVEDKVWLP